MSRLKPWLPLILIGLALLLNVAGDLKPDPKPTQQPIKSAAFSEQKSQQQESPPLNNPDISHTPRQASTPADKKDRDPSNIVIAISALVSAVAALGIVWFNFQLIGVTRDLHKATEAATEAAKQSAKVAELTFNYERPYLLVETVAIKGIDSPEGKEGKERAASAAATLFGEDATKQQPFRAEVRMRNFGRGPAVIVRVRCRLAPMTAIPERGDFRESQEKDIFVEAVPPAGDLTFTIYGDPPYLTGEDFQPIGNESRIAVALGRIDYEDILRGPQHTQFCWVFRPLSRRNMSWLFSLGKIWRGEGWTAKGPPANNART
jgi:hypothetical protein